MCDIKYSRPDLEDSMYQDDLDTLAFITPCDAYSLEADESDPCADSMCCGGEECCKHSTH